MDFVLEQQLTSFLTRRLDRFHHRVRGLPFIHVPPRLPGSDHRIGFMLPNGRQAVVSFKVAGRSPGTLKAYDLTLRPEVSLTPADDHDLGVLAMKLIVVNRRKLPPKKKV